GRGRAVAQAQPSASRAPAGQRRIEFSSPDGPPRVFTGRPIGNGAAWSLRRVRRRSLASPPGPRGTPVERRSGAARPCSVLAWSLEGLDGAVLSHVLGEDGANPLGSHLPVVDLVLPAHELEVLLAEGVRRAGAVLADDDVRSEMAEPVAPAPGE